MYMDMGMFRIYPNIYALLVAPTGRCRKSTAINIGMKILRRAQLDEIKIVGPKITPEALVKTARRETAILDKENDVIKPSFPDSVNLIFVPELAVMLDKRDYNAGMVPLLTDLFDCPDDWSDSTIGRGEQKLRKVFISTLFASTQRWLRTLLPRSAFAGGFMGRLFICVMDGTERCFPTPIPPDQTLMGSAILQLQRVGQGRGEFIWTKDTQRWFSDWYMTNKKELESSFDERISSYLERKQITLIKFAMILAVNDGRSELKVDDFRAALSIIEMFEEDTFRLFSQIEGGDNPDQEIIDEFMAFMNNNKMVASHTEIMKFMVSHGVLKTRAMEIISLLMEAKMLVGKTDGKSRVYKLVKGG